MPAGQIATWGDTSPLAEAPERLVWQHVDFDGDGHQVALSSDLNLDCLSGLMGVQGVIEIVVIPDGLVVDSHDDVADEGSAEGL